MTVIYLQHEAMVVTVLHGSRSFEYLSAEYKIILNDLLLPLHYVHFVIHLIKRHTKQMREKPNNKHNVIVHPLVSHPR